jgi:WD40 repeat protein
VWAVEVHGHRLFSASADKTIRVWDIDSRRCEHVLEDHTRPVLSLAISGNRLYSGSYDFTIKVGKQSSSVGPSSHNKHHGPGSQASGQGNCSLHAGLAVVLFDCHSSKSSLRTAACVGAVGGLGICMSTCLCLHCMA